MHRSTFLRTALAGGGLSFPSLLRLRAQGRRDRQDTAVILLYCHGDINHIDTWDPKPGAPEKFRGPFLIFTHVFNAHRQYLEERGTVPVFAR